MKDKTKALLELAIDEATARLTEYSPADLNALIKALSSTEKIEPSPMASTKKLSGFISNNLGATRS